MSRADRNPNGKGSRGRTVAAFLSILLAGCSGLLHSTASPDQVYYLQAKPAGVVAAAAPAGSLRISHPVADPGLDSDRIVLLRPDRRMDFYAGSRWPGPATQLIEALAVETLRAGGTWRSVEGSTSPFPSDYLLQISVRHFEADYASGGAAPEAHVVLDCILGRREGRTVLKSFRVEGRSAASANRLGSVVAAFEDATNAALGALSTQILEATQNPNSDASASR